MKSTKLVGSAVAILHKKLLKYNLVNESKTKYKSQTDKSVQLTIGIKKLMIALDNFWEQNKFPKIYHVCSRFSSTY